MNWYIEINLHQFLAQNHIDPAYALVGLLVGALVGTTGVGGGSLMTPILVLLFGINPTVAVGTDLLFASITKGFGTAIHGSRRTINWKIVGLLALGSIPATALTLWCIHLYGKSERFTDAITQFLGVALILTAITLAFRDSIMRSVTRRGGEVGEAQDRPVGAFLTIAIGLSLGVLVSLSSVGAGALGATLLILIYPRLPLAKIVGSDIAHAVPLTLLAGIGYFIIGDVNLNILAVLLVGSIPGIIIGSYLAPKIPEKALRLLLATVLIGVGVKLISSRIH